MRYQQCVRSLCVVMLYLFACVLFLCQLTQSASVFYSDEVSLSIVDPQAESASVLFEIPTGSGRILYLAYEFQEPATGWVHALLAATMYPDFIKH